MASYVREITEICDKIGSHPDRQMEQLIRGAKNAFINSCLGFLTFSPGMQSWRDLMADLGENVCILPLPLLIYLDRFLGTGDVSKMIVSYLVPIDPNGEVLEATFAMCFVRPNWRLEYLGDDDKLPSDCLAVMRKPADMTIVTFLSRCGLFTDSVCPLLLSGDACYLEQPHGIRKVCAERAEIIRAASENLDEALEEFSQHAHWNNQLLEGSEMWFSAQLDLLTNGEEGYVWVPDFDYAYFDMKSPHDLNGPILVGPVRVGAHFGSIGAQANPYKLLGEPPQKEKFEKLRGMEELSKLLADRHKGRELRRFYEARGYTEEQINSGVAAWWERLQEHVRVRNCFREFQRRWELVVARPQDP